MWFPRRIALTVGLLLSLAACGEPSNGIAVRGAGAGSLASTRAAATSTLPTPSVEPEEGMRAGEPPTTILFVDGELLELGSAAASRGKVPFGQSPGGPPVLAAGSVLVEVGVLGDPLELWMVGPGGVSRRVAQHTSGTAVSADGTLVAYAQHAMKGQAHYGETVLTVVDVASGDVVSESAPLDGYGRTVGFVGEHVAVQLGDGASTRVALWNPGTDELMPLQPEYAYSRLLGVHPSAGLAAALVGDGICWRIVAIDPATASTSPLTDGICVGTADVVFSPDGSRFALVGFSDGPDMATRLFVGSVQDGVALTSVPFDGAEQVIWESETSVLVTAPASLGGESGSRYAIYRCDTSLSGCQYAGEERYEFPGHGALWMIGGTR